MANKQISVIAEFHSKPDCETEVKQILLEMVKLTRQEAGCINYDLHQGTSDKSVFFMYENWSTPEHLQAHAKAAHFAEMDKALTDLLSEKYKVTLLEMVGER